MNLSSSVSVCSLSFLNSSLPAIPFPTCNFVSNGQIELRNLPYEATKNPVVFSVSTLTVNTSGVFGINVIVMEVFDETSRNVTDVFYGYTTIHPSSLSLTTF